MSSLNDAKEFAVEYEESLNQLTFNSRPHIMSLTMLANENKAHAPLVVKLIEGRILEGRREHKMPTLYLMDSIVKNHPNPYKSLFEQNIVKVFSHVFGALQDIKIRQDLYKLRQTWIQVFSSTKMYQLDVNVNRQHDPKWPVLANPSAAPPISSSSNIHINPALLNRSRSKDEEAEKMAQLVRERELELMKLKAKKLEVEMERTKKALEEAKKASDQPEKAQAVKSTTSSTSQKSSTNTVPSENSLKEPRAKSRDPRARGSTPNAATKREEPSKQPGNKSRRSQSPESRSNATKVPPPPPTIRSDVKTSKSPVKSQTESLDVQKKKKKNSSAPVDKKKTSKSDRTSSTLQSEARKRSRSRSPGTEKKKFRIPKKSTKDSVSDKKQSASGKRKSSSSTKDSSQDKKSKLNDELFGDGSERKRPTGRVDKKSLPSPSVGWAKFKATNPDEFRTPLDNKDELESCESGRQKHPLPFAGRPNRTAPGFGPVRGSFRHPSFPNMQQQHLRSMMHPPPQQMPHPNIRNHAGFPNEQNMLPLRLPGPNAKISPHTLEHELLPQIMNQAREMLRQGHINQEQFSNLMKEAFELKEKAIINFAEETSYLEQQQQQIGLDHKWNQPPPLHPQFDLPPPMMPHRPPNPRMMGGFIGERMPGPQNVNPPNPSHRDLPNADPDDLALIQSDLFKSIKIDDQFRDIRFYDETATCVMGVNDIRELSFKTEPQQSSTRRVILDGNADVIPPLELGDKNYTEFYLNGSKHMIKLGAPTRELWIDGRWYECYFDKQIKVQIGQTFHQVFLEGPAPSVHIGSKRPDLCAGYVQLIVDANIDAATRIYLDYKPQLVYIDNKAHIFRFMDKLKTLVINGHPFRNPSAFEFGNKKPIVIYVNGIKHYCRLTSLPAGVRVGEVLNSKIPGGSPEGIRANSPPGGNEDESTNSAFDQLLALFPKQSDGKKDPETLSESDYNIKGGDKISKSESGSESKPSGPSTPLDVHNLWNQLLGAGLVSDKKQQGALGIPGLDVTSPTVSEGSKIKAESKESTKQKEAEDKTSNKENTSADANIKKEVVKPIVLKSHHSTLKTRQQGLIDQLFDPTSLQCKNCGLRYKSTEMASYSQHLDWHFRMKRREKENAKRAQSRKWYIEQIEWIVSDEIEEEEKDVQESGDQLADGILDMTGSASVPVSDDPEVRENEGSCPICHEEFEKFYKDEGTDHVDDGRWHYRNAVRPPAEESEENSHVIYHPQCLQDRFKNSSALLEEDDSGLNQEEQSEQNDDLENVVLKDAPNHEEVNGEEEKEPSPDIKEEPMDTDEGVQKEDKEDVKEEEKEGEAITVKPEPTEEDSEFKTDDEDKTEKITEDQAEGTVKKEAELEPETTVVLDDVDMMDNEASLSSVSLTNSSGIKINITSQVATESAKDSSVNDTSVANNDSSANSDSEFDSEAIIQEPKEEKFSRKPKLKGKKFQEFPLQMKGKQESWYCSVM